MKPGAVFSKPSENRVSMKRCKSSLQLSNVQSLENMAWRSLADTYRTVHFHIMSDLRHYGLTPPQYTVLRITGRSERGFLPMNEIGKEMIVTYANVTTIVDNLEKRGLVRRIRNTTDRRIVNVQLTGAGSRLFGKIYSVHHKRVANLMRALSESELRSLLKFTTKIRNTVSSSPR